jgi:hypothetical protein
VPRWELILPIFWREKMKVYVITVETKRWGQLSIPDCVFPSQKEAEIWIDRFLDKTRVYKVEQRNVTCS